MKIDTIRALAVYGIAAYIVWKTLTMLEGMVAAGTVGGDAALGIIGGLVLAVAGFLFAAEQSKGTQAAFERGLNTPAPGQLSDQATPGVLAAEVKPAPPIA